MKELDDLFKVGSTKPMGYLSDGDFQAAGTSLESMQQILTSRGLHCLVFDPWCSDLKYTIATPCNSYSTSTRLSFFGQGGPERRESLLWPWRSFTPIRMISRSCIG